MTTPDNTAPPLTALECAALRKITGLSVQGLSDVLGVDERTVRRWESGTYTPSPSAAGALRDVVAEHTRQTQPLLLDARRFGAVAVVDSGEYPSGWTSALAARVLLECPSARVALVPR